MQSPFILYSDNVSKSTKKKEKEISYNFKVNDPSHQGMGEQAQSETWKKEDKI